MITTLSTGDRIHVGDSVTLTVLAIEGNRLRLKVESSESEGPIPDILIEGRKEPDFNWWERNEPDFNWWEKN